jgi:pimeloyl-ACP methyl ester carboxylesterase
MAEMETLVFVPGLNCTDRLFGPQIEALRGTCRTLVADHRRDDSMEAIARRLLDETPERFALAGLSMGGYICLEVMRQAPERVTRLALLDTSARPDSEEATANRRRLMALAEAGRLEEIHRALWERLVHPDHQGDAALEDIHRQMLLETGAEAYLRQQEAIIARADSRSLLPGIEIPTLVLVGAEDVITPPELAREMAEPVEWASLVVVPHCGHLSSLEQPEAVTRALRAWLVQERGKV